MTQGGVVCPEASRNTLFSRKKPSRTGKKTVCSWVFSCPIRTQCAAATPAAGPVFPCGEKTRVEDGTRSGGEQTRIFKTWGVGCASLIRAGTLPQHAHARRCMRAMPCHYHAQTQAFPLFSFLPCIVYVGHIRPIDDLANIPDRKKKNSYPKRSRKFFFPFP